MRLVETERSNQSAVPRRNDGPHAWQLVWRTLLPSGAPCHSLPDLSAAQLATCMHRQRDAAAATTTLPVGGIWRISMPDDSKPDHSTRRGI